MRRSHDRTTTRYNLLTKETVLMTVLAQDPSVVDSKGPVRTAIPVPASRLQRGPRGHRFHVVDVNTGNGKASAPVPLHTEDPWTYADRWTADHHPDATTLNDDRDFRAQNLYAVAAHTLALFEQHLGRPIPWHSGFPQLFLVPQARIEGNAFYSRQHNAVLFGWLPALAGRPAPLYTALSYDVIAHEVSHAILDGLRPRFTEPGLPDQLAFHEALADLMAMLSVFALEGVAEHLLDPKGAGHVPLDTDAAPQPSTDPERQRADRLKNRAGNLMTSPLLRLAEQLGIRRTAHGQPDPYPALRRSVKLEANDRWITDATFAEPHRRAEVLVAAFLQTFVAIWAGRLEPLRTDGGGLDTSRVAEEGVKSARHLLGMLLRALDYLPPVELEFADVIAAVVTADQRLAPDDEHDYRGALRTTFLAFGIAPAEHRIIDADDIAPPLESAAQPPAEAAYPPDPDTTATLGLRYEHLNLVALRTSPEEVYQFIWNNAAVLEIDVRLTTRVERVLSSTRVGPDGLVVTEILADYIQILRTTAGNLPPGMRAPAGMAADTVVELWGGGVVVFDQFGRFRLHQRQPILDLDRQNRRLQYLFEHNVRGNDGSFGASDGAGDQRRFALLHQEVDE
ncbi:MAG TPA: hypothetical protein VNP92_26195 [Actinophytocola sp.]|nr:hypothetical protein [Actinophytocola sp.]